MANIETRRAIGVETGVNDEFTGQLPGRLLRGTQPAPLAKAPGRL